MQSVVPISQQINQFSYVKDNLTAMIGSSVAGKLLSKSLIFISVGGNDVLGYFAANSTMLKDQFISILISAYSRHIKVNFFFILVNLIHTFFNLNQIFVLPLVLEIVQAWSQEVRDHKRATGWLLSIPKSHPETTHWCQWLL